MEVQDEFVPTGAAKRAGDLRRAGGTKETLTAAEKRAIWGNALREMTGSAGTFVDDFLVAMVGDHPTRMVVAELAKHHVNVARLLKQKNPNVGLLSETEFEDFLEVAVQMLPLASRERVASRISSGLLAAGITREMRRLGEHFRIVPLGSPQLEQEVMRPAAKILEDPRYKNAADSFADALGLWRKGAYPDTVHKACNAMEGIARTILDERGEAPSKNAWRSLVSALVRRGLVPSYLDTTLGGSVATLRNQEGAAHGAGPSPPPITADEAWLAIFEAATVMIYLADRDKRVGTAEDPKRGA